MLFLMHMKGVHGTSGTPSALQNISIVPDQQEVLLRVNQTPIKSSVTLHYICY